MPCRIEFSACLRTAFVCSGPLAAAIFLPPVAMAQTGMPGASAPEAMPAHRVAIDPITRQIRLAEPADMLGKAAAQAAPQAAAPSAPGQAGTASASSGVEAHPAMKRMQSTTSTAQMGAGVRRFDASSLQFSVVKRDADGKLSTQCVHGDHAAHDAVHSKAVGVHHDN